MGRDIAPAGGLQSGFSREEPGQRPADHVRDLRPRQRGEGQRAADLHRGDADAGGQRAVDDALAEAAREAGDRWPPATEPIRSSPTATAPVARRWVATMREQPPGAEEAGMGAVGLGDAADHADVLRERGEDVDEGERDQRGGAGDGAGGRLDLAAGARRRAGRGACARWARGWRRRRAGRALLLARRSRAQRSSARACVEAGEPAGERQRRLAVGAGVDRRRPRRGSRRCGRAGGRPRARGRPGRARGAQERGQRQRRACRPAGSGRSGRSDSRRRRR